MSLCRITATIPTIRYSAKSAAGAWRLLSEGDALANDETLEVISGGPSFGVTACIVQNRVSGAWANALTITLDVKEGTSHTRQDKLTVTGDASDSTVTTALTFNKGHLSIKRAHDAQVHAETTRGVTFSWNSQMWLGVLSEATHTKDHGEAGFYQEADARLVANRAQFAAASSIPTVGAKLSAGDSRFVVTGLTAGDVTYSFDLRRNNG